MYRTRIGSSSYTFESLKVLLARATPFRSGDALAGVAASSAQERVAAQMALADLPLTEFLNVAVLPEDDEVGHLVRESHDRSAFGPISHLTVGGLREWLLDDRRTPGAIQGVTWGLTPEMVAAVSKIMRLQDLVTVAARIPVVTRFRSTIGLPGTLCSRLQPNHPSDSPAGILASTIDGLLMGSGDACIGINPATDSVNGLCGLLHVLNDFRERFDIPTQTCVLSHVTTTLQAIERHAPVDLVFQSIAGTEAANRSFGVHAALLREAHDAARSLGRVPAKGQCMYFETGQGSALSAGAHHGIDQQTLEVSAYGFARLFDPFLVNTVVGFIGPEYLQDGKQVIRAGLEDHFCGKLLGLPMGVDVCYTNHMDADQDDMDALLALLASAGCNYVMGLPGADDIMLNYQSTSFHDVAAMRALYGKEPAPEFREWLERMGVLGCDGRLRVPGTAASSLLEVLHVLS